MMLYKRKKPGSWRRAFFAEIISNYSSGYSAKSDLEAPHTGHFHEDGISLNGVPGFIPLSGSPSAGS